MTETELPLVSLENLGGGAAVELFDRELQKVLDNITDPNTQAAAVRTVTLKIKIKPSDDRDYGEMSISCVSSLAPTPSYPTHIFIGQQHGQTIAREHNPKQARLFPPRPNVHEFPAKETPSS